MAIRRYDFVTGITTSSAPSPATPSNSSDVLSKGYADTTYSPRSSWYDKQANITAIKGIATADRSNGQVVFNYGTDAFYKFDSASSATGDDDLILTPTSGTGRWFKVSSGSGSATGNSLIQEFDEQDAGILAGEALTNRDALAMEIHNGSGSNVYRFFKTDHDLASRRSFVGFARATVSVTANVKTYTIDAAYVSGNTIPFTVNGRSYSTTYASSSDATLQALATAIQADQDILTATVTVVGGNQTGTDDRVIVITGEGGLTLNISGTTVTGGASQPGVTIGTTTAAVGNAVDLHQLGPLDGFSGLTTGLAYYVSGTAGAITSTAPDGQPIYVGKAMSSTVLYVDPKGNFTTQFGSTGYFVRSHGSSTGANAGAVQDSEIYNGAAWASGASDTAGARNLIAGNDGSYNQKHHVVGGANTSGTVLDTVSAYDRVSWSTLSVLTAVKADGSGTAYSGYLYQNKGYVAAAAATSYRWNGSVWGTGNAFANANYDMSSFAFSAGLMSTVAGFNPGHENHHETKNSSDTVGSATVTPIVGTNSQASLSTSSIAIIANFASNANTTASYSWNGSAWSSSITSPITLRSNQGGGFANMSASALAFGNGGNASGDTSPVVTSQTFNGTAFSSSTSSTNARGNRAAGSVV